MTMFLAASTNVMGWVWLAVFVGALVLEFVTYEFVSIWFAASALLSIGPSFIPGFPWWGQVVLFAVMAGVLLLSLRKICMRYFLKAKANRTNSDAIIGKEVRMITEASFDCLGSAKVGDVVWSIKSEDGTTLAVDEIVEVTAIEGNKLIAKHTLLG